jgi:hypothetical protein
VDYVGSAVGSVNVLADGGSDYDRIRMRFEMGGGEGEVRAQAIGGANNDFLDLFIRVSSEGGTPRTRGRIDGGEGDDVGRRTLFVVPVNLEVDNVAR